MTEPDRPPRRERRAGRVPGAIAIAALGWSVGTAAGPAVSAGEAGIAVEDTVEYFTPTGPLARLDLAPYGDLRLRDDFVHARPGATADLHVQPAALRAGLAWLPPRTGLRLEAGLRAALSSDRNRDPWVVFRNETPDTVEWDRAQLQWTSPAGDRVLGGKTRLPLRLSEMLWDDDLRPVGAGAVVRLGWFRTDALGLALGWFNRSRLGEDGRLGAGQLSVRVRGDADTEAEATLSYLRFDHLDVLARRGLARQNATVATAQGPAYVADFEPIDLQIAGHARIGPVPVTARLDLIRNLGFDRDRDGARARLALGGGSARSGLEVGWVYQRIEREALPGAFNSDDWWFHTRMRGHHAWLQVGTDRPASIRVAGFIERRDDVSHDTRRLTAELRLRLPEL